MNLHSTPAVQTKLSLLALRVDIYSFTLLEILLCIINPILLINQFVKCFFLSIRAKRFIILKLLDAQLCEWRLISTNVAFLWTYARSSLKVYSSHSVRSILYICVITAICVYTTLSSCYKINQSWSCRTVVLQSFYGMPSNALYTRSVSIG